MGVCLVAFSFMHTIFVDSGVRGPFGGLSQETFSAGMGGVGSSVVGGSPVQL